ncbi:Crp/Fnr family transcriptional regulator [Chryseobacterium vrystaatense]|uniref:cAMP-binding domain of CRP or a regulatory subunit of cAMP-dependent protein kinases n=1 Tax=Chryseobacterium vrystaatense TaxID=307480 RepID=A0A1M5AS07_9FLAO|nr:Crp/Fnr family transcriptional regulator [Chryseobacterium vrystaatense]SHF33020.1 cAMP-binding domain of CRP or a regulatory subunit of cAMP-dependent protein kinases [Chryseobacterium vrystaatense]
MEILIKNILKHVTLTQEEITVFKSCWSEKTLEKGEFLLRNGETCRYDSYIVSGVLKAFCINSDNGNEEILFLAIDNWWATDISSFSKQQPSMYNIQAVEKTILLQISHTAFQKMLQAIPSLERYFRIILEGYLGTLEKRIVFNNMYKAEQKYYDFLNTYPDIVSRVPQYLIASYLGVSAEFISRIRKKNKSS